MELYSISQLGAAISKLMSSPKHASFPTCQRTSSLPSLIHATSSSHSIERRTNTHRLKACLTPIDAKYIQLCGTVDDIAHPCLCRSYPELDSCYDIYCSDPSKKPQLLTDALAKCKEKNTQVTDDSEASTTTNGGDEATEDGGDGDEMLKDDMAAMVTPSATGASGKLSVPLMMVWVFFAMFAVMAMAASVPVSQNYW